MATATNLNTESGDLTVQGDLIIKDGQGKLRIRLDSQTGNIHIHDAQGNLLFLLDTSKNTLRLGGHTQDGDLLLFPKQANDISGADEATIHCKADDGTIRLGGNQTDGRLLCKNKKGQQNILLDGESATAFIGGNSQDGEILIQNKDSKTTISLHGASGTVRIGAAGQDGELFIQNKKANPAIRLIGHSSDFGDFAILQAGGEGINSSISLFNAGAKNVNDPNQASINLNSETGSIHLGGSGTTGDLLLFSNNVIASDKAGKARIHLDASTGNAWIGGNGVSGDIVLFPKDATFAGITSPEEKAKRASINLNGATASARLGGNGTTGDLLLFSNDVTASDDDSKARIHLDAHTGNAWVGGNGVDGDILIFPKGASFSGITNPVEKAKLATIQLDGEAGDIILRNADCAEEFEVVDAEHIEPGSTLVISSENELSISTRAYDKRLAGIVSGAGEYKPGILLDKKIKSDNRLPVALMGKVYCKVDTINGSIESGDLLTSSNRPGYAMKATDPVLAMGAIIGKALKPLHSGSGLIPVLVSLQ